MCLIISPVTVVDIAISVDQTALSIGLVSQPIALIDASVTPNLVALTLSVAFLVPVSFVSGIVLEYLHISLD